MHTIRRETKKDIKIDMNLKGQLTVIQYPDIVVIDGDQLQEFLEVIQIHMEKHKSLQFLISTMEDISLLDRIPTDHYNIIQNELFKMAEPKLPESN